MQHFLYFCRFRPGRVRYGRSSFWCASTSGEILRPGVLGRQGSSFLKKRTKKLLFIAVPHCPTGVVSLGSYRRHQPGHKSFLRLFFKKEVLAFAWHDEGASAQNGAL
jgi:hypothetical protein